MPKIDPPTDPEDPRLLPPRTAYDRATAFKAGLKALAHCRQVLSNTLGAAVTNHNLNHVAMRRMLVLFDAVVHALLSDVWATKSDPGLPPWAYDFHRHFANAIEHLLVAGGPERTELIGRHVGIFSRFLQQIVTDTSHIGILSTERVHSKSGADKQ